MKTCGVAGMLLIGMMLTVVPTARAHVTLDRPRGGEVFAPGQTVTLEWHVDIPHDQQNWDLYYSIDGGATWRIVRQNLPVATLTYDWLVPEVDTEQAVLRVVQDNTGMDYESVSGTFTIHAVATAVEEPAPAPEAFGLTAAYPNPFFDATTLRFAVPHAAHVVLTAYDLRGRAVATLVDRVVGTGAHAVAWDPASLAPGAYVVRLTAAGSSDTITLLVAR